MTLLLALTLSSFAADTTDEPIGELTEQASSTSEHAAEVAAETAEVAAETPEIATEAAEVAAETPEIATEAAEVAAEVSNESIIMVVQRPAPARVVVVPGVGVNAGVKRDVKGFSAGFVGHARALDGADAQAFVSTVARDVRGTQASGFVNVAGGSMKGAQATGFVNAAGGDVKGAQASGFVNIAGGDVKGVQATGFVNIAGGAVRGVQASSALNIAAGKGSKGVQASGGLNVARDLHGTQAGLVNVATEVKGTQAGLLNVAGKSRGVNVGLVNIAKESDAVNIGLLNLIGDGIHHVDVWASESSALNVDVKLGGKHVYTLIGAGTVRLSDPWWTFGAGMGVHIPVKALWMEVDVTSWGIASTQQLANGTHGKLRGTVGLKLGKRLAPFAGVSLNSWISGDREVTARAVGLPSSRQGGGRVTSWPGVHAGLQF